MLRLRRITSGATWIPQVDGLRFIAIVSVVLFHAGGEVGVRGPRPLPLASLVPSSLWWLDRIMGNGDRGVELFFVISGFILARPFLREHRLAGRPVSLSKYFLRRLTRLEPPYLLCLLLYAASEWLVLHPSLRTLLPHLLASMLYVHNLTYGAISTIDFVTWSLEVEVQFYLIAPLLGMLYRIPNTTLRRSVFVGLILLATGVSALCHGERLQDSLLNYAHYFLTGFLLADLLEFPRREGHTNWWWDLVSLAGWPAVFLLPHGARALLWLPWIILPLYCAAFYGKASNWFFRRSFVAITGGMCYSIYLLHMLFISTAFLVIKHHYLRSDLGSFWLQTLLLLPPVFLCSAVYYVLVERPCMDPEWPQKLRRRLRGSAPKELATGEP